MTIPNTKIVLVTGATGRQGGATARELIERDWRVRALVRNPDAPAAQELKEAGAELARGDLEDRASLKAALQGAQGVFSVQNFWGKGVGYEGEIRQGRNLAEEAHAAGVEHFVQASIAACDSAPQVSHFASKHEVEKIVDQLGLPRTFLRTVFFMDNFLDPKVGKLMLPVLGGALRRNQPLHMIATRDIGRFAADAFDNRETYLGQIIDIAGDALTVGQMKDVIARVSGKRPSNWRLPAWLFALINEEMAQQLAWNNTAGWSFSPDATRALRPDVLDFERFWRAQA